MSNEQPPEPPSIEPRLSLDQLATLAGVSARTVRYYIQQGLVSRPEGAKRGAYYVQRHVEQLLLIQRWTQAGLSLERVRELCAGAPEDPPRRAAAPGTVEVWSNGDPESLTLSARPSGGAATRNGELLPGQSRAPSPNHGTRQRRPLAVPPERVPA